MHCGMCTWEAWKRDANAGEKSIDGPLYRCHHPREESANTVEDVHDAELDLIANEVADCLDSRHDAMTDRLDDCGRMEVVTVGDVDVVAVGDVDVVAVGNVKVVAANRHSGRKALKHTKQANQTCAGHASADDGDGEHASGGGDLPT